IRIWPCGMEGILTLPSWLLRTSHSRRMPLPSLKTSWPLMNFTTTLALSTGFPFWFLISIVIDVIGAFADSVITRARQRSNRRIVLSDHSLKSLVNLFGMPLGLHLVEDLRDLSIFSDEKGRALDAHVLLAVHALLFPNAVFLGNLMIDVGQQRE